MQNKDKTMELEQLNGPVEPIPKMQGEINEDKTTNTKEVSSVIKKSESEKKQSQIFGWGKFRPKFLQFLNSPRWFLLVIFLYTLNQGITVYGLPTIAFPAIEKRFSLSGKQLGIIASSNDITALLLVVFISFYGDYGNKIKWIGGGAAIAGIGILLFALPHAMAGSYDPPTFRNRSGGMCSPGNSSTADKTVKCLEKSGSEWYHMAVFVISQLVAGVGFCPLFSLVPPYLDENVEPKQLPIFLGVWYCGYGAAPGIGLLLGGKFASLYVDIKQPSRLSLTPKDPRWIGAWWLGFVIFGLLIILLSILILGFPKELPGARERREKHIREGNLRKADDSKKAELKEILPQLKGLLTNWAFLFNSLGVTASLVIVGSFYPFLAKVIQAKFGLDTEKTGYLLSSIMTPSKTVGVLIGAWIVKQFSLKTACKKAALLVVILKILSIVGPFALLLPGCRSAHIAGISASYFKGKNSDQGQMMPLVPNVPLSALCNLDCRCSLTRFSPVCGSDNVTYFDPCHAGCKVRLPDKKFANCSCIPSNVPGLSLGSAKYGYCDRDCQNVAYFLVMIGIALLSGSLAIVPSKLLGVEEYFVIFPWKISIFSGHQMVFHEKSPSFIRFRCVPDNKRAFATGLQYISLKTLGLIPGPIIFGHIVDLSCRLWQDNCGKKGRCFDYDVDSLSRNICLFGSLAAAIYIICYFLSWYFLPKPESEAEKDVPVKTILNGENEDTNM